jgi:putative DNA primase/helicase
MTRFIEQLTDEQKRCYFESRLGRGLPAGKNVSVSCPFHQDKTPSLSVDAVRGIWKCHAGCGQGGLIEFEMRFSTCEHDAAIANIAGVCGLQQQRIFNAAPEAVYPYCDEDGNVLFEKLRYPGKRFSQRMKDSTGRWIYNLADARKVLYNLPDVITANLVFVTEGEKDADNLKTAVQGVTANQYPRTRLAVTTNFDGAGKWRPEYSLYFAGKRVVVLPDNDGLGKAHALAVASSVFPYAHSVKVVELPGLPPKGDVSDYLGAKTGEQLLAHIVNCPLWRPEASKLVIPAPQFLATSSPDVDWMVNGLIQRGSDGFICAFPKVGKSWLAVDLAIALALGEPWVGFEIPRPVKTALVTREDNPALTKWRMDHLLNGRGRDRHSLEGKLYVNSREQSADFRLDKPDLLTPMLSTLKEIGPEFVVLDVFNIMHAADENDNTEMREVLEQLNMIRREVGCSFGVVHHFNKTAEGTLSQRMRGSSAISGWAEWLIGIEAVRGEKNIRRLEFELKAASPEPVCYTVATDDGASASVIGRTDWTPDNPSKKLSRAGEVLR